MQFVGIIGTKPFISKSCSPAFCSHNSNSNEIDFGRLDAGLLRQWDLMKEFIWFRTTMSSAGVKDAFLHYVTELVEGSGETLGEENDPIRVQFKRKMKDMIRGIIRMNSNDAISVELFVEFSQHIARLAQARGGGKSPGPCPLSCACSAVFALPDLEGEALPKLLQSQKNDTTRLLLTLRDWSLFFIEKQKTSTLKGAKWKKSDWPIKTAQILQAIAAESLEITKEAFAEGEGGIGENFEVMRKNFGGIGLLNWGNLVMVARMGMGAAHQFTPFQGVLDYSKEMAVKGKKITAEELQREKVRADKMVTVGKFKEAIKIFGVVAELDSSCWQVRNNSAAARLKIAGSEPIQYYLVVHDCTYALEQKPDSVRALYRRGIALNKLKKFKAAIIDFEKALELDPTAPIRAELASARKNA